MLRKPRSLAALILLFLVAACGSANTASTAAPVEEGSILDLVCGSEPRAECLSKVCDQADNCPVIRALSSQPVFNFVETYSACLDCSTPDFPPESGVGKCIEYSVSQTSTGWTVIFRVSENCSFRYGTPAESWITVILNSNTMQIGSIAPPVEYIADPLYCQVEADCFSLSGSGVQFIGCSNYFYAPLNWSGYLQGNDCGCEAGQCTKK
jgi:hypothetical protein